MTGGASRITSTASSRSAPLPGASEPGEQRSAEVGQASGSVAMVSGGRGHHRRGQHFDSLVQGQRIASTHALLEQVNSGLGLTSRVGPCHYWRPGTGAPVLARPAHRRRPWTPAVTVAVSQLPGDEGSRCRDDRNSISSMKPF
jgi:hypothetical protein